MRLKSRLLSASILATVGAAVLPTGTAAAQEAAVSRQQMVVLDIPAGPASTGLNTLATQADVQIFYPFGLVSGRSLPAIKGEYSRDEAIRMVADAAGLSVKRQGDAYALEAPQSGSASDGADGTVEALIVTAQKREEDIQDVPIAISAFTQEQLERSQVAGGPDLMTQVPNMTFTKTNFSSYSIQLRGIGTQAISATTDAAVAVAFNNTPFIRNRFFEQEFYDLQRVEVLRGPQGTLYGRNATAGVVNLISQKPGFGYEAKLSADVANYGSTRLEGMLNIPLAEDVAGLRVAGAWTKREGYSTNQITGNPIDGRDLWSTRVSLRVAPSDRLEANLIWEHFQEDDDRLRSGKQLCRTHEVTSITSIHPDGTVRVYPTDHYTLMPEQGQPSVWTNVQATFSQGCAPASLYSDESFQTPNGFSLPYYGALTGTGFPAALLDPYVSRTQSHDLRVIESTVDPEYRAKADVIEFQFNADITDHLTLTSETAYSSDFIFSKQDYNRFNTASGAFTTQGIGEYFVNRGILDENGVFCDPQIGCADRLVGVDVSTARSRQFSQELRIGSDYDGPFNFSLGANYLRYDTNDKYYVFFNSLTLFSAGQTGTQDYQYIPNVTDNLSCMPSGTRAPDTNGSALINGCMYIDPNPIGSLNDRGHNYFLSNNPYKLISYAVFGEAYYQITDALKLTAGLRWAADKKDAPRIPSWVLAANTVGYPVAEVVRQEWEKPTGRLTIDWKPDLGFTDETLVYASYAHGYKAGGMNPPAAGLVCYASCGQYTAGWNERSAAHPKAFDPEYVDAYEIGSKNTLLDGALTLNLAAFYYDYQAYQLSQIVDRSAISQNFDANVWGLEIEADWRPLENLRFGFKGGYEDTKVADGMRAIDLMDRTAGTPGWVVVSPFPTFPSNCVLPAFIYDGIGGVYNGSPNPYGSPELVNVGNPGGGGAGGCELAYLQHLDPVTGEAYVADPINVYPGNFGLASHPDYPGWDPTFDYGNNQGEGFFKDLSGNELPNAPHYTATITTDYTIPLPHDWLATLHTDLYYQSEAWTRIFNMEGYDRLKAYTNVNLAAIFTNEDAGWKVMAYVKNVMDRDSITGAFLNSDDTGLTTNVFLTEPRLYGVRVSKGFRGGPWWTGADLGHTEPFPLTVEIAGQVQRHDAPNTAIAPESLVAMADPLAATLGVQNRDMDWGDGRSVKVTWRPGDGPWSLSGSARYGRTNTDVVRDRTEKAEVLDRCYWGPGFEFLAGLVCPVGSPFYDTFPVMRTYPTLDWSDEAARQREEHFVVDLKVNHDLPLTPFSSSVVGVGIRHATVESTTTLKALAQGGWIVPEPWQFEPVSFMRSTVAIDVDREFRGFGPILTWDAASSLWDGGDHGHFDLEWSLTGGALFGKQKSRFDGQELVALHSAIDDLAHSVTIDPVGDPTVISVPTDRSHSVTIPVVDLSAGLSYEVGRIKVGAGYRWERYFDVLDAGFEEAESVDRTIDGPYFKLAVGFGG